ncbi:MAG: glycoside hydrolase family 140 protein [Deltaproteobacteria bacterium]|nr:glycoside hydrolase family 140 protein [Deltaproteobacteria bacterium]
MQHHHLLARFAPLSLCLAAFLGSTPVRAEALPKLKVSADNRNLIQDNGKPFFYLADTGWELFHRLNRQEAVTYLDTRARQKYTVIQAVAVAELNGVTDPNAYGDKPFIENNFSKPAITPGSDPKNTDQYDYWDHVDFIVDAAATRGIYIALLPAWGRFINNDKLLKPENAEDYGVWLGKRYAKKNVIWVLGGDRDFTGQEETLRKLAKGITIGVAGKEDYSQTLMTLHPCGGCSSSRWFHNDPWLDFDMQQNGHNANVPVWTRLENDRVREPTKPVMDGEPLYEDHPVAFNAPENGYSVDADVRKFAYWDLLSGAFGHTYGHHSVWQMYAPGRDPINGPTMYWYEALNRPGAGEMQYARALLESRPLLARVPDPSMVAVQPKFDPSYIAASRGEDYAMFYSAEGRRINVKLGKISGEKVKAWWFNPRTGGAIEIGTFENKGSHGWDCPSKGYASDWVLVLDDASKNYPAPGTTVRAEAKATAPKK